MLKTLFSLEGSFNVRCSTLYLFWSKLQELSLQPVFEPSWAKLFALFHLRCCHGQLIHLRPFIVHSLIASPPASLPLLYSALWSYFGQPARYSAQTATPLALQISDSVSLEDAWGWPWKRLYPQNQNLYSPYCRSNSLKAISLSTYAYWAHNHLRALQLSFQKSYSPRLRAIRPFAVSVRSSAPAVFVRSAEQHFRF